MVGRQIEPELASILERSRAIADRRGPRLRLERDLTQIARESRTLPQQPLETTTDQASTSSAALRLLSSYGSAPSALERKLHASALLDTLSPVPEADLPSLVAHRTEMTVVAAIQSTLNETKNESMRIMMEMDKMRWDEEKGRLVSWSGGGSDVIRTPARTGQSPSPYVGKFANSRSVLRDGSGNVNGVGDRDSMRPPSVFVGPVREAVESRGGVARRKVRLASLLRECVATGTSGEVKRRRVGDLFMAMSFICREQGDTFGILSRGKFPRAVSYLAWQMREKMKTDIAANPIDAARGGIPGTVGDVHAWLSVAFARGIPEGLELYKGVPLWGMIWYCMRVGDLEAALEVANDALSSHGASTGMGDGRGLSFFVDCLKEFCKGRGISTDKQDRLAQEFTMGAGRSADPYWRACVVVVGGSERERMQLHDEDYALLFAVIEDYLFLRLASVTGNMKRDAETLTTVQAEIEKFGPGHFDRDGNDSAFYALVLVLAGRLPAAVKYLEMAGETETAVHVALIDQYYDEDECCCQMLIDYYGKVVWGFVSRFMSYNETDAAIYLMTIGDRQTREMYLKRLILETRSFDKLLGRSARFSEGAGTESVGGISKRRVGVIEALWPLSFPPRTGGGMRGVPVIADVSGGSGDWKDVAGGAARDAEANGDREAALRCFEAAEEEENVVRTLIEGVLGEMASGTKSTSRRRILEYAQRYLVHVEKGDISNGKVEASKIGELKRGIGLFHFFECVERKSYQEAWSVLQNVGLFPTNEEELMGKVAEVRRGMLGERVDEVMLAAVNSLMGILKGEGGGSGRGIYESDIREGIRMLVNFGGLLGTSAEVGAKLVKMEAMMV